MNKVFCSIIAMLALLGCDNSGPQKTEQSKTDTVAVAAAQRHNDFRLQEIFTLNDAEEILGQKAVLKDSATTVRRDTTMYSCAYAAEQKDKTGKEGVIYFLIEEYSDITSAHSVYAAIKAANDSHEGIKPVHDLGDEAYFHSDGDNFYFIMVRKGGRMFRMKVNKITSHTSLNEFNLVAKKITGQM